MLHPKKERWTINGGHNNFLLFLFSEGSFSALPIFIIVEKSGANEKINVDEKVVGKIGVKGHPFLVFCNLLSLFV